MNRLTQLKLILHCVSFLIFLFFFFFGHKVMLMTVLIKLSSIFHRKAHDGNDLCGTPCLASLAFDISLQTK